MAFAANREPAMVGMFQVIPANEGVQRGDAVYEADLQDEIQRTVHSRRRSTAAVLLAEYRRNVVGTQRFMALAASSSTRRRKAIGADLTCAQRHRPQTVRYGRDESGRADGSQSVFSA